MKITNAYVNITSPGRNFVTLKIETDEGIYGLGDGTLNGRELAVASYLTDHVIPCIIGRDSFQTEDIWQYLYRGPYWRRGPVTMAAIAAVDVALWDIKGKALNTPVYNLLGGKSREGVMVYCHATGRDIDEALEDVARHKEMGLRHLQNAGPVRAGRARAAVGVRVVHRALSAPRPQAVCAGARSVWR
jgi:mannonate dehydratase